MKFVDDKKETVIVVWSDHMPSCEKCRRVELEKSATFVSACWLGSKLLMEELTKRQAPVVSQKENEIKAWAEKTGVFKMWRGKPVKTRYVGDA